LEQILAILRRMGAARIAMLVVALVMLIGLMSMVAFRGNAPDYGIIYGGLNEQEQAKIAQSLDAMNVKYQVRSGGVYAPKDKIAELRLKIAGEGIVGSSTAGYEIFDTQSAFGTTSLVQNINARRALEGELGRTITSLPTVASSRVHLVMPKKKLFSRERIEPTASVVVNIGTRILSDEQVQSITHMVAASVPGLTPDNVTVIDNRGNMLSSGNKSQSNVMNMQQKIQRQVEVEYEQSIKRMLEKVVGPNKANVKVTAELNFDSIEEESEIFDPEKQVVRSEQRSEDRMSAEQKQANQAAGVSANIPGQEAGGGQAGSNEERQATEETINYEISKTIRRHVTSGGAIQQLSVAVLVEGNYSNEDGIRKYIPYDQNNLDKFETLIKTAIGYDESRGDLVEIVDLPFATVEEETFEEPLFTKEDYFMIAEYALIGIGIFLLIFMIIKPILKATLPKNDEISSAISNASSAAVAGAGGAVASGAPGAPAINIQGGAAAAVAPDGTPLNLPTNEIVEGDSMIDLASVEGQVRESSIKKVIKMITDNPEESTNVIRGWLQGGEAD
jgi:flagellar M-ring protein FliF